MLMMSSYIPCCAAGLALFAAFDAKAAGATDILDDAAGFGQLEAKKGDLALVHYTGPLLCLLCCTMHQRIHHDCCDKYEHCCNVVLCAWADYVTNAISGKVKDSGEVFDTTKGDGLVGLSLTMTYEMP